MVEWVFNRAVDVLVAMLFMVAVLWYLLTQPVFSLGSAQSPELGLDSRVLESRLIETMMLAEPKADDATRFAITADYMRLWMSEVGDVEQIDRGEGLKILRLRVGEKFKRRVFVGLHYVVTERPILEAAETITSLMELARLYSTLKETQSQLDLTVFIHRPDTIRRGLIDSSLYHVAQLSGYKEERDLGLLFAPGLSIPDAVYVSEQWRYYRYLLPSSGDGVSLFGRFKDVGLLRNLKSTFYDLGLGSVNSLNIPTNFPGMLDSPLKFYWDEGVPMLLLRPDILINDKNYSGHIKFISVLFGLLQKP